jgi:hypothetical protein
MRSWRKVATRGSGNRLAKATSVSAACGPLIRMIATPAGGAPEDKA